MPNDPYYRTPQWRQLRKATLTRDRYRCVVPGCHQRATHVDHIKSRKQGGADALHNLRSLCGPHDSQIKERSSGLRGLDGQLSVKGTTVDGKPLDPQHPWNLKP